MTNVELLAKIKAEIERRRYVFNHKAVYRELDELLSFLSTLESEKPMNQEGLKEEIQRFISNATKMDKGEWKGKYPISKMGFNVVARYFAQWGAEHLATSGKTLEIKPDDEVTINGHKIVYDKDKGYVTIVKSEESVPKDLEEAADNHIRKVVDAAGHPGWDWTTQDIADAFIAGAEWQKEQDEILKVNYEGARTVYDNTVQHLQEKIDEKYELGKKDMKEQMLKGAVEGVLVDNVDGTQEICLHGNRYGEKVRIIIVKEDEK